MNADADKDRVCMALKDLLSVLSDTRALYLDDEGERRICSAVLKQLGNHFPVVHDVALECVPFVVRRCKSQRHVGRFCLDVCVQVKDGTKPQRQVAMRALRKVLEEFSRVQAPVGEQEVEDAAAHEARQLNVLVSNVTCAVAKELLGLVSGLPDDLASSAVSESAKRSEIAKSLLNDEELPDAGSSDDPITRCSDFMRAFETLLELHGGTVGVVEPGLHVAIVEQCRSMLFPSPAVAALPPQQQACLRAGAVSCLGALASHLEYEALDTMTADLCSKLAASAHDHSLVSGVLDLLRRCFESAGSRYPKERLLQVFSQLVALAGKDGDAALCGIRESALQVIDVMFAQRPGVMLPLTQQLLPTLDACLSYDPNIVGAMDDDEEMEEEEDEDDDELVFDLGDDDDDDDDDGEDFAFELDDDDAASVDSEADLSDDEDHSWQVRRASAQCIATILSALRDSLAARESVGPNLTHVQLLRQVLGSLAPLLVRRFVEREANIKQQVFSCFRQALVLVDLAELELQVSAAEVASVLLTELRNPRKKLRGSRLAAHQTAALALADAIALFPFGAFADTAPDLLSPLVTWLADHEEPHNLRAVRLLLECVPADCVEDHVQAVLEAVIPICQDAGSNARAEAAFQLLQQCATSLTAASASQPDAPRFNRQTSITRFDIECGLVESGHRLGQPLSLSPEEAQLVGKAHAVCVDVLTSSTGKKKSTKLPASVKAECINSIGVLGQHFAELEASVAQFGEQVALLQDACERSNPRVSSAAVRAIARMCRGRLAATKQLGPPEAAPHLIEVFSSLLSKADTRLRKFSVGALHALASLCAAAQGNMEQWLTGALAGAIESLAGIMHGHREQSTVKDVEHVLRLTALLVELGGGGDPTGDLPAFFATRTLTTTFRAFAEWTRQPRTQALPRSLLDAAVALCKVVTTGSAPVLEEIAAFESQGQLHSALLAAAELGSAPADEFVRTLMGTLASSEDEAELNRTVALLGEVGRTVELGVLATAAAEALVSMSTRQGLTPACAVALGGLLCGNAATVHPVIQSALGGGGEVQHVARLALREMLTSGGSVRTEHVSELLPLLLHGEGDDEAVQLSVEVAARLGHGHPDLVLPQLDPAKAHSLRVLKFFVEHLPADVKASEAVKSHVVGVIAAVASPDLAVRFAAVSLLQSVVTELPSALSSDLVRQAVLALLRQAVRQQQYIKSVQFGPITRAVDEAIESRKAIYECLYHALDRFFVDDSAIIAVGECIAEHGLTDEFEVQLVVHPLLSKLLRTQRLSTSAGQSVVRLADALRASLGTTVPESAVRQEQEAHAAMVQSGQRVAELMESLGML